MSAYRVPAYVEPTLALVAPRGLVRVNGSVCKCTAPGQLWCWWFDVKDGDQWYCRHGGGWVRHYSGGIWLSHQWKSLPPKEDV